MGPSSEIERYRRLFEFAERAAQPVLV
jgi:hypothetical protein